MDVLSGEFNEREVMMGDKQEGRLLLVTLTAKKSANVPVSPKPGPCPVETLPSAQAGLREGLLLLLPAISPSLTAASLQTHLG